MNRRIGGRWRDWIETWLETWLETSLTKVERERVRQGDMPGPLALCPCPGPSFWISSQGNTILYFIIIIVIIAHIHPHTYTLIQLWFHILFFIFLSFPLFSRSSSSLFFTPLLFIHPILSHPSTHPFTLTLTPTATLALTSPSPSPTRTVSQLDDKER